MNLSSILRGKVKATALDSYYSEKLGTIITCEITSGVIKVGDSLMIHQAGVASEVIKIAGIEMDGKIWQEAYPSESVGLLIRNHDLSYFISGAAIEAFE
jgi:translation elongation factor EF-1alpha